MLLFHIDDKFIGCSLLGFHKFNLCIVGYIFVAICLFVSRLLKSYEVTLHSRKNACVLGTN